MKPVVTPQQMKHIDEAAPVGSGELVQRAGWHVARVAKEIMGGTYGRSVLVIAGPGNNGADGRIAAQLLRARGCRVRTVGPDEITDAHGFSLVIDAAFGTGFHGNYKAPAVGDAKMLAVDIPSGVDGSTGAACAGAVEADVTVTFAAYKPGHWLNDGPNHCGRIELCDIGLDTSTADVHVIEDHDLDLPAPGRDAHKWQSALTVIAGSPGMQGAAHLCSTAATRAGSGMVRLGLPGVNDINLPIGEAVARALPQPGWASAGLALSDRSRAVVIGPGLGRDAKTVEDIRRFVSECDKALVIDADALFAFADDASTLRKRQAPTVLTPHDGEYERLTGAKPGIDRIAAARRLAESTNSVVLLKGSTSVISTAEGGVFLSTSGGSRLATAGTGDVLAGIIGAFMAQGLEAAGAASQGAHVHGLAARRGRPKGLVAGDLPVLVADVLSDLVSARADQ